MKKANRYAYIIITLFFCIIVLVITLIIITHNNSSETLSSADTPSSLSAALIDEPEYPELAVTASPSATDVQPSPYTITTDSVNEESFYISKITDDIYERIVNCSYPENCSVPLSDLRFIHVLHYGFDNKVHEGELIVGAAIADDILDIFMELYSAKYPIERIRLIDEYDADDESSMQSNNTSAFNYRVISGADVLSNHALGLAIDINPLYNPYVHGSFIQPKTAEKYADRDADCSYYIRENDVCYNAFISRGFTWGGNWTTKKDYQHFEKIPE